MKMKRRVRNNKRGQSLTEWAVIAPVIIVLFLGAAQLGYILYTKIQLETTAREASRAAALAPVASGAYTAAGNISNASCPPPSVTNPACTAANNSAGLISTSALTTKVTGNGAAQALCPTPTPPAPPPPPEPADGATTVEVDTSVPIFVPLIGNVFGTSSKQLTSSVTTRVEPCFFTTGS